MNGLVQSPCRMNMLNEPILIFDDHHDDQRQCGQGVSADRGDRDLHGVANAIGGDGEPRHEFAGMTIMEKPHVLMQQVAEKAVLHFRHHARAGARHQHLRPEAGRATQGEKGGDTPRQQPQLFERLALDHVIENGFQKPGACGGRRGADGHTHAGGEIRKYVLFAVLDKHTPQKGKRAGVGSVTGIGHNEGVNGKRRQGQGAPARMGKGRRADRPSAAHAAQGVKFFENLLLI